MRTLLLILVVLMLCSRAPAQALPEGISMEELRSASFSFSNQICTIVLQAVVPALAEHQDLLDGGTAKYSFRLDREGHLHDLKVVSSTSNKFVENTCLQMIRVAKFPPIPKEVIAEQGHDWVDVSSEVALTPQ
jgi:TonB family protein